MISLHKCWVSCQCNFSAETIWHWNKRHAAYAFQMQRQRLRRVHSAATATATVTLKVNMYISLKKIEKGHAQPAYSYITATPMGGKLYCSYIIMREYAFARSNERPSRTRLPYKADSDMQIAAIEENQEFPIHICRILLGSCYCCCWNWTWRNTQVHEP